MLHSGKVCTLLSAKVDVVKFTPLGKRYAYSLEEKIDFLHRKFLLEEQLSTLSAVKKTTQPWKRLLATHKKKGDSFSNLPPLLITLKPSAVYISCLKLCYFDNKISWSYLEGKKSN